jgi:predicted lipoprotein with Yx(FWY)xxD motif
VNEKILAMAPGMMRSRAIWLLLAVGLLLPGCGEDDDGASGTKPAETPAGDTGAASQDVPKKPKRNRSGTRITLGESEFGSMLFDTNDQAIYIFENDPDGDSVCYGECAEAWPPVFTKGEPRAGEGVDASLLGTIERRDGRRQVSYGGKPLYFYANEAPGEVRCHNVNLNGGLWWAVGANGKRLP